MKLFAVVGVCSLALATGCLSSKTESNSLHEHHAVLKGGSVDANGFVTVPTNGMYEVTDTWSEPILWREVGFLTREHGTLTASHTNQSGGTQSLKFMISEGIDTNAAPLIVGFGDAAGNVGYYVVEGLTGSGAASGAAKLVPLIVPTNFQSIYHK